MAKGKPIECRDLCAKYTFDVLGNCAFGLSINSLSEEDSEFHRTFKNMLESKVNRMRHKIRSFPYWIARLFKSFARNADMINFLVNTLKDTMEYRKKNNIRKNDIVDSLMDIKDNPQQVGEGNSIIWSISVYANSCLAFLSICMK